MGFVGSHNPYLLSYAKQSAQQSQEVAPSGYNNNYQEAGTEACHT